MLAIQEATKKLVACESLSVSESEAAMRDILSGKATGAQIGGFLVALRMKGETAAELLGCARAMRASAVPVRPSASRCVDTCGTGGDMSLTFNVSTIAALVAAGAGVHVAKHGNRSVSSSCGSADLLEELGVRIALTPEQMARCVDEVGVGFLFAPLLHPAMAHAMGPRRELAMRTVFNLLGPLTNPAGVLHQVVGVFDGTYCEAVASVLDGLGAEHAMVVHGYGGLDELSTAGPNQVVELRQGRLHRYMLDPADLGLPRCKLEDLRGGGRAENARIALKVLQGERGPRRDTVVLNTAAALYAADAVADLREGIEAAERSIDCGAAFAVLQNLVAFTSSVAEAA